MAKSNLENSMEMEAMMLFNELVKQLKRIADTQEELVRLQKESQNLVNELASFGQHNEWQKEP